MMPLNWLIAGTGQNVEGYAAWLASDDGHGSSSPIHYMDAYNVFLAATSECTSDTVSFPYMYSWKYTKRIF
jgi:hypothetical protein